LAKESFKVESPRSGFITKVNTAQIGHAIAAIGGGRVRIEDNIDPSVGFVADVKIGNRVTAGESLGAVFCDDAAKAREAVESIQAAYTIGDEPPAELPELTKEVINE
jgi:thymidine phosphorylase